MKSLLIVLLGCVLIGLTSAANNCPGWSGAAGVNCTDASLCCGYGTIYPQCLPADGSKKCCTYFKGATQCNPDQTCGGGGGPGASSYATCGPPGSTFCSTGTGQGAFCNETLPTCCGYSSGFGFCCAAGCACNNSYYSCSCPAATSAPSTSAPSTSAPTTPAPPKNNCPGAGSYAGVNCSDPSLCCGYGSLSPTCLPADGSKKCCTHYLAATQCDNNQVCGGGLGPGASSYATCGPPGSTYCDKGTGQGAFCNATLPTCCGYNSGYGFCCAAGCACNNSYYSCDCPVPTTPAPTTPAPTTPPPPRNNCPGAGSSAGVNCSDPSLCCGYGTITPSCLPADGSKKCCTHYLSARQCNPNEVCGGSGGPGASSYAQCGPPGSTFCDKGDGQGAFCNATLPTCCGYYGAYGFCCAPGCSCNNSYYTCSCPTPTTPAPTTPPPPRNNCPGAAGTAGVNCSSPSLCCGSGTMTPSCLPADGSKTCCTHYLASTQCKPNEVCGGGGGPGASSYAQCGPPGSTYCNQGTGQGAFCNATLPTCCGNYGVLGFCCAPGCTCNNSAYSCSCPTPPTKAPTVKPPPPPPKPTPKPKTCRTPGPFGNPATCGPNQKCCGARNSNAFCCGPNQRCDNVRRGCVSPR